MSGSKKIIAAGAVAAALSTTPQANAQELKPVDGIQYKTRNLTGDLIVIGDQQNNNPTITIGGVNHGRENGVSAQILIPTDSITYGIAGDVSKTQSHIIGGTGTSFDNGYVYATGSHAREEHYGKTLEANGGSIGGAYISDKAIIDGSVIVHQAKDAHLSTDTQHSAASSVDITGNIKTTTTTHTKTTTRRDFDGQTRGHANLGATFDVGQNGEVRVGAQHEFGMNDRTSANIQYNHYFNDDRSKWHISANTDKHYEAGVQHAFNDSNWSVGASVFSENNNGQRNNGGMVGVTYRFGGGKAPALRTNDTRNANARMNAELRDIIHTSSSHAVKNIDTLGNIVTTQTVEHTTTEHKEKLDTLTAFKQPTFVVENGNTIRVTHHGILDMDGVENVEYVLTTVGGTEIKNKTGVFEKLLDGTYTITTNAEVKNGNTNQFSPALNKEPATVTIDTVPVVPVMTQAEFDNIISKLPISLQDGKAYKKVIINLRQYLWDDIKITWYDFKLDWGTELPNANKIVSIPQKTITLINNNYDVSDYSITLHLQSHTNPILTTSHTIRLPAVDPFWF